MSCGAPDLLAVLDAIDAALIPAAIARLAGRAMTTAAEPADELLTPEQAAMMLRVDKRWLYKHARQIGVVKLSRRKVRFSRDRIERWLRTRK